MNTNEDKLSTLFDNLVDAALVVADSITKSNREGAHAELKEIMMALGITHNLVEVRKAGSSDDNQLF